MKHSNSTAIVMVNICPAIYTSVQMQEVQEEGGKDWLNAAIEYYMANVDGKVADSYAITKSLGKGLYCLENGHKEVLDRVWGTHLKPFKIPHAFLVRCNSVKPNLQY